MAAHAAVTVAIAQTAGQMGAVVGLLGAKKMIDFLYRRAHPITHPSDLSLNKKTERLPALSRL